MRRWYKYTVVSEKVALSDDDRVDRSSRKSERLSNYDDFLRFLNLHYPCLRVLSVASGEGLNEATLLSKGLDITCSDIVEPETRHPDMKFIKHDVLGRPTEIKYDAIINFSFLFMLKDVQAKHALWNMSRSLRDGGNLLVDHGGPTDNWLSFFIHDVLLLFEACVSYSLNIIRGDKCKFVKRLHGYRRTDKEIECMANKFGLKLIDGMDYSFLSEFKRSRILRGIVNNRFFERVGWFIPHLRPRRFQKDDHV